LLFSTTSGVKKAGVELREDNEYILREILGMTIVTVWPTVEAPNPQSTHVGRILTTGGW